MTRFIRPAEFADRIGVSTRTLARLVAAGKIVPAVRTEGRHGRYTEAQAAEWLARVAAKRSRALEAEPPNLTHRGRELSDREWVRRQRLKALWRQQEREKAKAR